MVALLGPLELRVAWVASVQGVRAWLSTVSLV